MYNHASGDFYHQSIRGVYWSQRLDNSILVYGSFFALDFVNPQHSVNRGDGFILRCLALEKQAYTTPILAPLSLVRGGNYNYFNGNLGDQSNYGGCWSHRLSSATNGYRLFFYSGYVSPQTSSLRGGGFALRCLER